MHKSEIAGDHDRVDQFFCVNDLLFSGACPLFSNPLFVRGGNCLTNRIPAQVILRLCFRFAPVFHVAANMPQLLEILVY